MKQIWSELRNAGSTTRKYIGWASGVYQRELFVSARTDAWYDKPTGTLRVYCAASVSDDNDHDWLPFYEVTLETHHNREQAYRRIIEIADAWMAKVAATIPAPDTRTDQEVIDGPKQEDDQDFDY